MIFWDYFDKIAEGIEFIMALGSIIGLLGLIVGVLGVIFLGQFQRAKMARLILVSVVLLAICGLHAGIKYFRI
ncbi:MAG: hypothetical protein ACTSRI_20345 [Promethearchaeota archaeon]